MSGDLPVVTNSNAWAITIDGNGNALSGNNNYAGGTTISAGTLSVASSANLGSADLGFGVTLGDGTLQITGTSTFNRTLTMTSSIGKIAVSPGQAATWSGFIGESLAPSALSLSGGGTLALTNTGNLYSLGTYVTGNSEVIASADGSLGQPGSAVNLGDAASGGVLGFASSFATPRDIVLGTGGGTLDTIGSSTGVTVSGVVSGGGGLTKAAPAR